MIRTVTQVGLDREAVAAAGLLERADELAALEDRLAEVEASGRGHVVLLRGEAGVGKTALVRELCDRHAGSVRVVRGSCAPLFAPRPLGPFLEIAESLDGELPSVVEHGAMPYQVVAELADELRTEPTVLVLEDVHWADEATLDVFRLLVRRVEAVPALVVVTYRDDEVDVVDPLRIVLGELTPGPSLSRMRLTGLSRSAVARLAEPHGVDAGELYARTAGNPFFVVEALAAGSDAIPETVRDAVLARAARLSPPARALLEAVATVPPRAELWLLERIAGEPGESLDECLASGMLRSDSAGILFRHELARLAVEDSIAPGRKLELHRSALAALSDPPGGSLELARLAHHAEAAGDSGAVLRFAPAAAARAEALGAHREAAAHYARTLRWGEGLSPAERAELLERRSRAAYLADDIDEAIVAVEEALELRRGLGQSLEEGESMCWLSDILWCPGRAAESADVAHRALALLEPLPPGRELARAHIKQETVADATRGLELARQLGDVDLEVRALQSLGRIRFARGGREKLEEALALAREAGLVEATGRVFVDLVAGAIATQQYKVAAEYLEPGLDYCSDRGLELYRFYLLAYRSRFQLAQGRWDEAAETAAEVLRIRRASIQPRIVALIVLALVRARRGDPGHQELLAEAWATAEPTEEPFRMGPAAAARAEVAWLRGDPDGVIEATERALGLAVERRDRAALGELLVWRRRAGVDDDLPISPIEPYDSELSGDWRAASAYWQEAGCPYAAALALADSGEEANLRSALEELQRLGARPAATLVAGRLRKRGARGLPRGPRRATRENPAGLTPRELEVLELVADGLRDSEIAARLVLSERTVGHHVGAILRKLGARNRSAAAAEAVRLGLVPQDR
ncbi:MAG TPA: AAA family ATPase [Gaiellaceae bacterium]|jgi:DNA-binding CsgD family transcriptional regulator/tetratricopeptide (TPR) repeat protein